MARLEECREEACQAVQATPVVAVSSVAVATLVEQVGAAAG